ncbi:MAG: hypothetical protein L0Z50_31010 [Verrucomicrobiales bacterium]|nr:hypothetical protein [Verrucomicrobiales bacterium]
MTADHQFNSNRSPDNSPRPGFKITCGERASLWTAFAGKIAADILFLIGKRLSGRWIGYRIDRLGCACHERAYARTARLIKQWEGRHK